VCTFGAALWQCHLVSCAQRRKGTFFRVTLYFDLWPWPSDLTWTVWRWTSMSNITSNVIFVQTFLAGPISCCHHMSKPSREFSRFIWWMQTERQVTANLKTKPTNLGGCYCSHVHIHHHHLLLLLCALLLLGLLCRTCNKWNKNHQYVLLNLFSLCS